MLAKCKEGHSNPVKEGRVLMLYLEDMEKTLKTSLFCLTSLSDYPLLLVQISYGSSLPL